MPTRRQLIQKIELNSDASSVTFSNIPQNYTDLKIVYSSRVASSGNSFVIKMWVNGATSDTNHSCRELYGEGTGSGGTRLLSYLTVGWSQGTSATANTFANAEIYIPNYTGLRNKTFSSTSVTENNGTYAAATSVAGLWSNTSAISSLTLFPTASAPFAANSTFYLYGITHVPIIRGGEVSIANGYKIHTFKNTASLQVIEGGQVEYLVIAGGGSGGSYLSGGGGAGGYRSSVSGENSGGGSSAEPELMITPGTYTISIGAGGAGVTGYSPESYGNNGSNSTLSSITSTGGGGGAYYIINDTSVGRDGGSGGGGGAAQARYGVSRPGGSGTANQGYAGGSGNRGDANNEYGSGGGGGAGAVGGNSDANTGSAAPGGIGISSAITGYSQFRAGGGGGVTSLGPSGAAGGNGGGGSGGASGDDGVQNTGGGGGGCRSETSGAGGSGIVIIRYPYDGN